MMGSSRNQLEGARNPYSSVLRILLGNQRDGFSIRTVDWAQDYYYQQRTFVMLENHINIKQTNTMQLGSDLYYCTS